MDVPRFELSSSGQITSQDGIALDLYEVNDQHVHVAHLAPHIIVVHLPQGDQIGIKVVYSSHCWTKRYDPNLHEQQTLFMDGDRPRVFDSVRYNESMILPEFLAELAVHRLYFTPSHRNFGLYNATTIANGTAYTAYFTLKKDRGKLKGLRHSIAMRIESAYSAPQPKACRDLTDSGFQS